jgi:hypothetical protein
MFMSSPELDLILILTEDIYKKPVLPFPGRIDWNKLIDLAMRNKFLYHTAIKILEDERLAPAPVLRERILCLKESEEKRYAKMRPTLEVVNAVLGDEPYLLSKTWRVFSYVTHDTDLIVKDLGRVRKLFEKSGYKAPSSAHPQSIWIREKGLLEIEPYLRHFAGPMVFMDDDFLWERSREVVMEGVKTRIPSVEVDILTFLADMGFRLYEIMIGDMLHLYSVAAQADWELIESQTRKHQWLEQFHNEVAVLNSFHRQIYQEPSPIEKYIPAVAHQVKLNLPYVTPFPQVTKALMEKGWINLAKLVAYYSVKLKRYPRLHKFYTKVMMGYPERLFLKYIYH